MKEEDAGCWSWLHHARHRQANGGLSSGQEFWPDFWADDQGQDTLDKVLSIHQI